MADVNTGAESATRAEPTRSGTGCEAMHISERLYRRNCYWTLGNFWLCFFSSVFRLLCSLRGPTTLKSRIVVPSPKWKCSQWSLLVASSVIIVAGAVLSFAESLRRKRFLKCRALKSGDRVNQTNERTLHEYTLLLIY
jgi:hypothetical protein